MISILELDIYCRIYKRTKKKRIKKKALKRINFISRTKVGIEELAKDMSLDLTDVKTCNR